jgi:hypothetical protein
MGQTVSSDPINGLYHRPLIALLGVLLYNNRLRVPTTYSYGYSYTNTLDKGNGETKHFIENR